MFHFYLFQKHQTSRHVLFKCFVTSTLLEHTGIIDYWSKKLGASDTYGGCGHGIELNDDALQKRSRCNLHLVAEPRGQYTGGSTESDMIRSSYEFNK